MGAAATSPTWLVLGAGGHARSVADAITRSGGSLAAVAGTPDGPPWPVEVMATDDQALSAARAAGHLVALGVGNNRVRRSLLQAVSEAEAEPVIARTSTVAPSARVGKGAVVLEHAHVGPGSVLGGAVIINTAAVVEHDCQVGEGAHIAPGAVVLGGARVGAGALVGSGARILPGVAVGVDAVVGAGAVVREDVPDGQTVVGVPAVPYAARPRRDQLPDPELRDPGLPDPQRLPEAELPDPHQ